MESQIKPDIVGRVPDPASSLELPGRGSAQTGSNQEMNANHQPWALEKITTHCQAARVGQSGSDRSGCLSVKAGKTKFTGSRSNHSCSKPLQINNRPDWVKPSQTKKWNRKSNPTL
jgi:hypothetical protein